MFLFFISFGFSFFFKRTCAFGAARSTVNGGVDDSDFGDRRRRTWKSPRAVKPLTDGYVCFVHGLRSNTYHDAFSRQTQPGTDENRLLLFHVIIGGAKYYECAFQTDVSVWTYVRNAIEFAENTPRYTAPFLSPEPGATDGKIRFKLLLLTSIKGCHAKEKRSGPGHRRRFQKHTCPV